VKSCCSEARSAAWLAALGLTVAGLVGCAQDGPQPAEIEPVLDVGAAHPRLPDDAERQAAELAALALAGDADDAASMLAELRARDLARRDAGLESTDLLDNGEQLVASMSGERAYQARAEALLEEDDLDPELRNTLEAYLEGQPLAVAERKLSEDRTRKIGSVFNQLAKPLSRFVSGGSLNPMESGRAAFSSFMTVYAMPDATTQERQALRAYHEFLARHPNAPEAPWVAEQVRRYEQELRDHRLADAIAQAELSLDHGAPEAALMHLDRADGIEPEVDVERAELRERARSALRRREVYTRSTLVAVQRDEPAPPDVAELAAIALTAPLSDVGVLATQWTDDATWGNEARFLGLFDEWGARDEDAFFAGLTELAEQEDDAGPMGRHARRLLTDPSRNPYARFERASDADTAQRARWVAFGNRMNGPAHQELWRPLEYAIDAPGMLVEFARFPVRAVQYPFASARFGADVVRSGERYLDHFPDGQHATEVHRTLEELCADRERWSCALEHHRALEDPDPDTILEYRENIAERTLRFAEMHPRRDMQASVLRSVVEQYGDLPQGREAHDLLEKLRDESTAQDIRVSKEFLVEHPQLWQPGGLGLRPELLDDDEENGELADEGVSLIGQRYVRIFFVEADPVIVELDPDNFARFAAGLDEWSYRRVVRDDRATPTHDPARDLFLERAQLGLLDQPDPRPGAESHAQFLGSTESFGSVYRRESILPFELVLQGGLDDFGMSVFPRVNLPRESEDAILYR
jgi:hypothetical protein